MSRNIASIEDLIAADEGLVLKPVPDAKGTMSIGYGRNLMTKGISKAEADFMRANDLADAMRDCSALSVWWGLGEIRQGVLLDMHYEMGFAGLCAFKDMLAALGAGDYAKAAAAMLDSEWARTPETTERAHRLAKQMEDNVWV